MRKNEKDEIKEDLKKYKALEAVANSDGGQILLETLVADIEYSIDILVSDYKTLPDIELRSTCANLATNLAIFKALTNSSKNKKFALSELKEYQS